MSGFSKLKKNVEAVLCFLLLGVLACVSVCFLESDKYSGSKTPIPPDYEIRKRIKESEEYVTRRRKNVLSEANFFIGAISAKPIFYYSILLRRNPFAPISAFKPPYEVTPPPTDIIFPEDLMLLKVPELEEGILKAQIRNLRTRALYSVKQDDKIGSAIIVKKVTRNGVTIGIEGRGDLTLKPPPKPLKEPVFPYVLTGTMTIGREMVAMIENPSTKESYFCRVGDKIGDYKVKEIKRTSSVLSGPKGKDVVLIKGETGE